MIVSSLDSIKLVIGSTKTIPVIVLDMEASSSQTMNKWSILVAELDISNPDSFNSFKS